MKDVKSGVKGLVKGTTVLSLKWRSSSGADSQVHRQIYIVRASFVIRMSRALNKYRGTLVGALVGDCLGSKYEGVSSTIPWGEVTNYTMTRIKDSKTPIPYTDDSAMTRAICKSLIAQNKYDNRSMAHEFVEEFFRDPYRGYGQAVGTVFERLRGDNPEDVTLPASRQFDGQGSYGNGAAMRISPLALFSRNSTEVQQVRHFVHQSIPAASISPPPPGNCGAFARIFVSPGGWARASPGLLTHTWFLTRNPNVDDFIGKE